MCFDCPESPVRVGDRVIVRGAEVEVVDVRRSEREFFVELEGRRFPLYFNQQGFAWRKGA